MGSREKGYGTMPRVEENFATHLSPDAASSLRPPTLPSKPCRTTSALVGKAYMAAGRAGVCLHTMGLLQSNQADLLKEVDDSGEVSFDDIREMRRSVDLSLRVTKETARAIGRSMAALVATERHLWLNLSGTGEKDRAFLLDAPISSSGLFCDAGRREVSGDKTTRTTFLGVVWDSVTMRAQMSPACVDTILDTVTSLKLGHTITVKHFQRVLGLMAAASNVIPFGLLYMRALQWWLRTRGFSPRGNPFRTIKVTRRCLRSLVMWKKPGFLSLGPVLGARCQRRILTMDASLTSWGAVMEGRYTMGTWRDHHLSWHINCLEMMAVFLALRHFLPGFRGHHVLVRTENTEHQVYPVNCPVASVLEFLQSRFSDGLSPSTLKVYVAALAAFHTPLGVAFLLAITSLKRVGDLQALSVAPSCLEFAPGKALVLEQEVKTLLQKEAIERVPPPSLESGYYSRYFIVPKKDGGLRPILDLRILNRSVGKLKFKMLTIKQIVSQIRSEDWFVTIDLKDAYFHVSILPQHRKFLRFAFGGEAYQYRVLPFGLALSPRTFTKCMDAALVPLRLQGIRILNYIDDWLILAQTEQMAVRHRDVVLAHIRKLGLRLNAKKSVLSPSQKTTFLGVVWDSVSMRARLSPTRIASILSAVKQVKLGQLLTVKQFQRLLGLMAAASNVIPCGLLYMRPLQWWLRTKGFSPRGNPLRTFKVTRRCLRALVMWRETWFLSKGPVLGALCRRITLTTDASLTGWGAVMSGRPAQGLWQDHHLSWHINCLEMLAVFQALKHFLTDLRGHHVLVQSDNTSVVSYINHQGGLRSRRLYKLARQILLWSQGKLLSLRAMYLPGYLNVVADSLSRQGPRPGEWRLHPEVVELLWLSFGRAEVDLFASKETTHCHRWFSITLPAPLGLDAMVQPWPRSRLYAFPPIALLPGVLERVRRDGVSLLLVAPFWPARVWFADLISLLDGSPLELPVRRDLLSQAGGTILHPRPELWKLWAWPLRGPSS
ncbi:uncharacterized protein LOC143714498 [Siphateles boraxobius]|uniref:uncharacterized protein LOC143714498 n=1 Tax=Siphateles boraxobius TaxID=180520 RepID=UPI004063054A